MGIVYTAMVAAQKASEDIQVYRTAITTLQLADMPVCKAGPVLLCDVSTKSARPIVPQFQEKVVDVIHSHTHAILY